MGLGKPGIAGRDAAACPETQGFGLAETSKPLRAGPFTLRACKIPGIREMARRAKAAAAAGFEDSEGFCKSLDCNLPKRALVVNVAGAPAPRHSIKYNPRLPDLGRVSMGFSGK